MAGTPCVDFEPAARLHVRLAKPAAGSQLLKQSTWLLVATQRSGSAPKTREERIRDPKGTAKLAPNLSVEGKLLRAINL
jgi:hypothetical protein